MKLEALIIGSSSQNGAPLLALLALLAAPPGFVRRTEELKCRHLVFLLSPSVRRRNRQRQGRKTLTGAANLETMLLFPSEFRSRYLILFSAFLFVLRKNVEPVSMLAEAGVLKCPREKREEKLQQHIQSVFSSDKTSNNKSITIDDTVGWLGSVWLGNFRAACLTPL